MPVVWPDWTGPAVVMSVCAAIAASVPSFTFFFSFGKTLAERIRSERREVTWQLRDALKSDSVATVQAILSAHVEALSRRQIREVTRWLAERETRKLLETPHEADRIEWRRWSDVPPDYNGRSLLVSLAGKEVGVAQVPSFYRGHENDPAKRWTHWAEMPRAAR